MKGSDITSTFVDDEQTASRRVPVPVLMVAHAPEDALTIDRCRIYGNFIAGRDDECQLTINDGKISLNHFQISTEEGHLLIEDLGSTNGTYLNGERLVYKKKLHHNAVIRIGQTVLVFHEDGEDFLIPPPEEHHGMVGRFHTAPLLKEVQEAALSKEHLLITGPSGCGKELAAKAIASIMGKGQSPIPFVTHNAACFTNDDDATSTLLGIANRAFTSVNQRPGLIEQAEGGVLFLDEIHNYTTRVQRSLLRIIEDRKYSRIGETTTRTANVRFLMASNAPDLTQAIAPDLLGRLRRSLLLPPLTERLADIPAIFDHILEKTLERYGISGASVHRYLRGRHYELMCLNGFKAYNVRGIRQLADIIATKLATGTPATKTIDRVFSEQFKKSPLNPKSYRHRLYAPLPGSPEDESAKNKAKSVYEKNKSYIITVYRDRDSNIASTERALKKQGIKCSRRWLAHYLTKWGVRQ